MNQTSERKPRQVRPDTEVTAKPQVVITTTEAPPAPKPAAAQPQARPATTGIDVEPEPEAAAPAAPAIAPMGPTSSLADHTQASNVRLESCESCHCGHFADPKNNTGNCHANPPYHQLVLLPNAVQVPGAPPFEVRGMSQWPFVMRNQFCVSGYRPKGGRAN